MFGANISVGKENIFLIEIIGNLISFDGKEKKGEYRFSKFNKN